MTSFTIVFHEQYVDRDTNEVVPRHSMTFNGKDGWTFEGDVKMTPRLIWYMNTLQELFKEFRRRDDESKSKSKESLMRMNK